MEEDAGKVVLIAKLLEHAGRRAALGVGEIDGIAQVENQRQAVDNHKHPLTDLVVGLGLLQMQGEEHHHNIEHIGIDDGRSVEHDAAVVQVEEMTDRHVLGEVAEVFKHVGYTGDEINHVGQKQVDHQRNRWGQHRMKRIELFHIACISCSFL